MIAVSWSTGKFGDVLVPISRPTPVVAGQNYTVLGMRWYAQGLFAKEPKPGYEIRAKELYQVHEGDFVYNRLFAWKGSFGIVGDDTAGGYVSGEFPCFRVKDTTADAKYLLLYLSQQHIWDDIGRRSSGQTNVSRLRLKERDFLEMEVPLPPLAEQQRIVARIEALAGRVGEAQRLRRANEIAYEALLRSILFGEAAETSQPMLLGDLVRLRQPDVSVERDKAYFFAGVYSFGRGVFRGRRKAGSEFAYTKLTRLRSGDFVYPKLMAWEGALGVVPPECDGCVVSTEFPVFEVDTTKVLPEILDVYFRTPSIWPMLSSTSTGTNVRRRRLNPTDFLALRMPVPPSVTNAHSGGFSLNRMRLCTARLVGGSLAGGGTACEPNVAGLANYQH